MESPAGKCFKIWYSWIKENVSLGGRNNNAVFSLLASPLHSSLETPDTITISLCYVNASFSKYNFLTKILNL